MITNTSQPKYFWKNLKFIKIMLSVALPVAFQFLISTSINMADTVMISSLGGAEIAAVGLVNQYVFFFIISCFGITSTGSIFFSQYFGDKDIKNIKKYLRITLHLNILVAVLFTVLSIIFPYQIMKLLIPDEEVVKVGITYLVLIATTFIPTAISMAFNTALRSSNRAKETLLVTIVSFFTNIIFNYIFIFGKFGAPALGVVGAAIGTIVARAFELILLTYLASTKKNRAFNLLPDNLLKIEFNGIKRFIQIGYAVIIGEIFWALGQLLFSLAYSRIGKDATAAIQLSNTIQNIFFILVNSSNSAAAVIIGQVLGANRKDKAESYSRYFLQIVFIIGLISSLVLILTPNLLMTLFTGVEPHIHKMSVNLLMIRGIFITFRFINGMLYVGIFRAGGLTKIPTLIEMATMWIFAIPFSFIGVLVLKLPIEWIFVIVSLEEFIKFFLIWPLYKKKSWLNNIT